MTKPKLYRCPYDKACTCTMDEPCKGCETWSQHFYPPKKEDYIKARVTGARPITVTINTPTLLEPVFPEDENGHMPEQEVVGITHNNGETKIHTIPAEPEQEAEQGCCECEDKQRLINQYEWMVRQIYALQDSKASALRKAGG